MFRLQSFPCIFEPGILTGCEVQELLSNHSCLQDLTPPACLSYMAPPFSASTEKVNSPHSAFLEQVLGSSVTGGGGGA